MLSLDDFLVWRLRGGSHYGRNDGDGNVYGDGKNVVNRSHAIILFSEQREDGVYHVVVDLSVLTASASRCPWTSQESSLRQFVCCSSPACLAQESARTVALAIPVRVGSPPVPGCSALHSSPMPFLGSTKAARLVGERCVPPLEKYGEELS